MPNWLPNLKGSWFSNARGKIIVSQSGSKLKGTAVGVNVNDHWGNNPNHRGGGKFTGIITNEGVVILKYEWGDGTYSEDTLTLSKDGKTLSGSCSWYSDSSKSFLKGSGTYYLHR